MLYAIMLGPRSVDLRVGIAYIAYILYPIFTVDFFHVAAFVLITLNCFSSNNAIISGLRVSCHANRR